MVKCSKYFDLIWKISKDTLLVFSDIISNATDFCPLNQNVEPSLNSKKVEVIPPQLIEQDKDKGKLVISLKSAIKAKK